MSTNKPNRPQENEFKSKPQQERPGQERTDRPGQQGQPGKQATPGQQPHVAPGSKPQTNPSQQNPSQKNPRQDQGNPYKK